MKDVVKWFNNVTTEIKCIMIAQRTAIVDREHFSLMLLLVVIELNEQLLRPAVFRCEEDTIHHHDSVAACADADECEIRIIRGIDVERTVLVSDVPVGIQFQAL